MIDYYPEIFTAVSKPLREAVPKVHVTGTVSTSDTDKFPCVAIEEIRNEDTNIDNGPTATEARLQYRVTVLSNKVGGRVAEARRILAEADKILQSLNFRRLSMTTQDGMYNNSAYKIEATYVARINQNGAISLSQ